MSAEISKPIKTLLVEDDPDLVEIAIELLELTGCNVTPVLTPEEALSSLENTKDFELLFTDYRFPSTISGIELADEITKSLPNIKTIIATGFDQETIQSLASANYKVIIKPYRLEALKELVKQLFPHMYEGLPQIVS